MQLTSLNMACLYMGHVSLTQSAQTSASGLSHNSAYCSCIAGSHALLIQNIRLPAVLTRLMPLAS